MKPGALLKADTEVRLGIMRLFYVRLRPRSGVTMREPFPRGKRITGQQAPSNSRKLGMEPDEEMTDA